MVKLALPPFKGTVLNTVDPCLKVTVPVGVVPLVLLTVAVKVTGLLTPMAISTETANATDTVARSVSTKLTPPELVLLVPSPPYTAVKTCLPAVAKLVVSVALPLFKFAVPSTVLPSLKVTVPEGLAPVTVAVSVMLWFISAGLGLADNVVEVDPVSSTIKGTPTEILALLFVSPL